MSKLFVTGIDTDVGKSYVTALLASYLYEQKHSVITCKIAQTGSEDISDDIKLHRSIMGIDLTEEDKAGLTCPYVFKYPASPHLSSRLEETEIDVNKITGCINELSKRYKNVIIEGVGGIYVPLTPDYTVLDYIVDNNFDTVVVTSPKLGSINHTLLTLDVLISRGVSIKGLIYNSYFEEKIAIKEDTKKMFKKFLSDKNIMAPLIEIKSVSPSEPNTFDFSEIFL